MFLKKILTNYCNVNEHIFTRASICNKDSKLLKERPHTNTKAPRGVKVSTSKYIYMVCFFSKYLYQVLMYLYLSDYKANVLGYSIFLIVKNATAKQQWNPKRRLKRFFIQKHIGKMFQNLPATV